EEVRLTKELVDYWLTEADKYGRDYRFLAAIGAVREAIRTDPARQTTRDRLRQAVAIQARLDQDWFKAIHEVNERRYPQAMDTLKSILAVNPDSARAHGKLGTLYAIAGDKQQAVEHLQAVGRCDPDDPYGYAMLGWLAYLDDRPDEALAAYQRADDIEPFDAKNHYHMGLALAKLGRLPDAEDRFRQVLRIDPKHTGACQALADTLRRQGKEDEALH